MAARPRPREEGLKPRPRPRPVAAPDPDEPTPSEIAMIEARDELADPEHPTRRMTRAFEELHSVARELGLPPMRVDWQDPEPDFETTDETRAAMRSTESLLADYEGLRAGPIPWTLDTVPAPEKPDEWLIEGLVRPGTTVMIAGRYGAAKSWISRQLALTAGAGLGLFLDRYAIARPLRVLVVDEDNGPDEEWRREETLLAHLDLDRSRVSTVRRISLAGVLLDAEPWQRWLRGMIRLHELDLVVLDPISEMHGGKELREDPGFRSLLAFLKRLKVDFPRTATVLVHHTRKPAASDRTAERSLDDVRGQWGQTPDVIALVSPMAAELSSAGGTGQRSAFEVHKRAPHSRLTLAQVPKGETGEGGLTTVADETTGMSKRAESDTRVLSAIDAGAATSHEIELATGMSHGGVYKILARLHKAGIITKRAPIERLRDPDDPIEEEPFE